MAERRFRVPEEDIEKAAEIYTAAFKANEFPVQAVATHFEVNSNVAAKMVSAARKRGLLPQTKSGEPAA